MRAPKVERFPTLVNGRRQEKKKERKPTEWRMMSTPIDRQTDRETDRRTYTF